MIIHPVPPFDFGLTVRYQGLFESLDGSDIEWNGSLYRRVVDIGGNKGILVSVESTGTVDNPELLVTVEDVEGQQGLSKNEEQELTNLIGWLFGVEQGLEPFYEVAKEDQVMDDLVPRFYGLHLPQTATVFECLALTVLGQFLSFGWASPMRETLTYWYGRPVLLGGKSWKIFPRPGVLANASIDDLRNRLSFEELRKRSSLQEEGPDGNLPENKARYLRHVSLQAQPLGGGVEYLRNNTDGVARGRLTDMFGVGPWTVEWVLLRGLARTDALPAADPRLAERLTAYYDKVGIGLNVDFEEYSKEIESRAELWRPYRSFGTTYLLATYQ